MGDHEREPGKHRDPLNRRRKSYEIPAPEVLGRDIITKLRKEGAGSYGKKSSKRAQF